MTGDEDLVAGRRAVQPVAKAIPKLVGAEDKWSLG
jgi:hypothetical protein